MIHYFFQAVYIRESHARDEWPVGLPFSAFDAPKTLEERCGLAQRFVDMWRLSKNIPVLVDSMDNAFNDAYAAWPHDGDGDEGAEECEGAEESEGVGETMAAPVSEGGTVDKAPSRRRDSRRAAWLADSTRRVHADQQSGGGVVVVPQCCDVWGTTPH